MNASGTASTISARSCSASASRPRCCSRPLGGTTYAWDSGFVVGLGVLAALALAAFVFVEYRAPELVLPLDLFRNRVFVVTGLMGFVVGFALFGALTYLPLFQRRRSAAA